MGILVVDDEEDICLLISTFLKKSGIKVESRLSVVEAEKLLESKDFDLHFLDLNLPDGTGFDLISQINEKGKETGVVMMSAFDSQEDIQKAMDLGVDLFLKKPFSKSQILNAVDTLYSDKQ